MTIRAGMSKKLPEDPTKSDEGDADSSIRVLNIDNVHFHTNDLDALNRLAQTDIELARIVVDQKDKFDRREHASFKFAVAVTSSLVLAIIFALTYSIIKLGVIKSLMLLGGIVASALFVRVVLTGKWSDTTVIGKIVSGIISILGGKSRKDDEDSED